MEQSSQTQTNDRITIKSQHCEEMSIKRSRKRWIVEENKKYLKFISLNKLKLQAKHKKDKQRIFNQMSKVVETRGSRQCKSHHQKLIIKFGSIPEIMDRLPEEIAYMQINQKIQSMLETHKVARVTIISRG